MAFVIASAVFCGVVFATSAFATAIQFVHGDAPIYYRICDALCKSQKAIGISIVILGIVGCIIGWAGCCSVTTPSDQVIKRILKPVYAFSQNICIFFYSLDNILVI